MPRDTFKRRTANSYHSHKRRAREAGQELDYTLDDLRKKVEERSHCPFCRTELTPENFACDHSSATSRGGSFGLWNVEATCAACNKDKGELSAREFMDIYDVIKGWPGGVRVRFLARLRRGGKFR